MWILEIGFVLLCVLSLKKKCLLWSSELNNSAWSYENTQALRGLLAVSIIIGHFIRNMGIRNELPGIGFTIALDIGVAAFFFLGGVACSLTSLQKKNYYSSFLKNRLIGVLLPYVDFILIYYVTMRTTGLTSGEMILEGFINGEPLSNSWYIVTICIFYFFVWLSFRNQDFSTSSTHANKSVFMLTVLVFLYTVIVITFWPDVKYLYRNNMFYPIGFFFGYNKYRIQKYLKSRSVFGISLIVTVGLCIVFTYLPAIWNLIFTVRFNWWLCQDVGMSISYVTLLVLMLYKFSFQNRITSFLGKISFELYLCHGMLMELSQNYCGNTHIQQEIFTFLGCSVMVLIAYLLHLFFMQQRLLFKR